MTTQPCIYPGCADQDGNPKLTQDGICRSCQRRYGRLLDDLAIYWAYLRSTLPTPVRRQGEIRHHNQVFGHPAEWASDTARVIVDKLNDAHDGLADHLHETPPPHPGTTEAGRVKAALAYLSVRIPELATYPLATDTAIDLTELHGTVRGRLGLTRGDTLLRNVPCMSCNLCALYLTNGGDDIYCGDCGIAISHERFGLLARHAIDTLIEEYDAQLARGDLTVST